MSSTAITIVSALVWPTRRRRTSSSISSRCDGAGLTQRRRHAMASPTIRTPRTVGIALLAGLVSSLIVLTALGLPSNEGPAHDGAARHHGGFLSAEAAQAPHGFTEGWLDGDTVHFFYTKD